MASTSDQKLAAAGVPSNEAQSPPSDNDSGERPVRKQLKETSIESAPGDFNPDTHADHGNGNTRKRSFEKSRDDAENPNENSDGSRKRSRESSPEDAVTIQSTMESNTNDSDLSLKVSFYEYPSNSNVPKRCIIAGDYLDGSKTPPPKESLKPGSFCSEPDSENVTNTLNSVSEPLTNPTLQTSRGPVEIIVISDDEEVSFTAKREVIVISDDDSVSSHELEEEGPKQGEPEQEESEQEEPEKEGLKQEDSEQEGPQQEGSEQEGPEEEELEQDGPEDEEREEEEPEEEESGQEGPNDESVSSYESEEEESDREETEQENRDRTNHVGSYIYLSSDSEAKGRFYSKGRARTAKQLNLPRDEPDWDAVPSIEDHTDEDWVWVTHEDVVPSADEAHSQNSHGSDGSDGSDDSEGSDDSADIVKFIDRATQTSLSQGSIYSVDNVKHVDRATQTSSSDDSDDSQDISRDHPQDHPQDPQDQDTQSEKNDDTNNQMQDTANPTIEGAPGTAESDESKVPKKKRSREELDEGIKKPEAPQVPFQMVDTDGTTTEGEPEKKRHRDNSQERDAKTADAFASSAFANTCTSSLFASIGKNLAGKDDTTSTSSFATSSMAAFAGSEKSPFGTLGATSNSSVFKPTTSGTTSFKSTAGPTGFGAMGSGFSGVGGGFAAAATPSGLTSFAAPNASTTFQAKPIGVEESEAEESNGDEENDTFEAEKTDDRFFEQTIETGEEEEQTIFSCKAKLFHFNKEWKERGIGTFKLNFRKNADGKPVGRMIMRADGAGRVMLNSLIFKGMNYGDAKNEPPKSKQILLASIEEGRTIPLLLRTGNEVYATELYTIIEDLLKEEKS